MMLRSNAKPPLARSPIRLRSRTAIRSNPVQTQTQSPPGSLTKSQIPRRDKDIEEMEIRPAYHTISCELKALARMVRQEFGAGDENTYSGLSNSSASNANRSPVFERGRFYEEYCARRNERLKRRKGETGDLAKKKPVYDLGVRVESAKKRESNKKYESARKSVPSTPMTERREAPTPRYSLRSSTRKENQKPPLPLNVEKSIGGTVTGRKAGGTRRAKRT